MAKRFLKTTVVSVIFALTLAVSASAATAGGATTTTAVNFRTGAGTNYGIISTLPAGTHVVVSERSSGNWATVVYNGTVGYISSDYLKRANDMDASFGTGTICGSYVRMRSSASTSSSILGTYNSGTTMTVTGVSGAWYKVDYNGTDGYVYSNYLSLSGVTSSGGSASGSNGSVKGSDVRMRSGPGTNYSILGTYQNGTALTVTGTENGWSKVTIGGTSGYIRSDYVSGGADSKTGYIKGTGVRMRSGASTTSSILGVYNTGTEMTITGESGNWYKVSYGGNDGYVSKDYMTTTKPSSGGSTSQTGYIKGNDVRLRSGAGTSYSILGTYNNGTPLTITGTSGDWTAVTINGVKGYVNSAYVSTTKTEGGNGGGSTPSTSIGETIVATAKQYMGAPYVYGGMLRLCQLRVQALRLLHEPCGQQHLQQQRHLRREGEPPDRRPGVLCEQQLQHRPRRYLHRQRPVHPQQLRRRLRRHQRPELELLPEKLRGRKAHRGLTERNLSPGSTGGHFLSCGRMYTMVY